MFDHPLPLVDHQVGGVNADGQHQEGNEAEDGGKAHAEDEHEAQGRGARHEGQEAGGNGQEDLANRLASRVQRT
jgi:hypothetical protein